MDNLELAESAKKFIKENKKLLISKFADVKVFSPVEKPLSIFMAGSPGAGKTEFSKFYIEEIKKTDKTISIVRIDADEIRDLIPHYKGNNSDVVQGAAAIGVEKLYDSVLRNKQNVIIDGTFANFKVALSNVKRSIEKGRRVMIFYIFQDPLIAWSFVKKREALEGRIVPKFAFIDAFFAAKENALKIKEEFGNKVVLGMLIKDFTGNERRFFPDIENIDNYLHLNYNKERLELIL